MAKKKIRKHSKKKTIIWSIVAVLLCAAVGVGIYFAVAYRAEIKKGFEDLKNKIEQKQDKTETPETQEQALAFQLVG